MRSYEKYNRFFHLFGLVVIRESFGFNIDILTINPINLSVMLDILIFFLEKKCVRAAYFKE